MTRVDHRTKVTMTAAPDFVSAPITTSSSMGSMSWQMFATRTPADNPFKGWFGVLWRIDDWAHRHDLHGPLARRLCDRLDRELTGGTA